MEREKSGTAGVSHILLTFEHQQRPEETEREKQERERERDTERDRERLSMT